jgi:hypothetical protein
MMDHLTCKTLLGGIASSQVVTIRMQLYSGSPIAVLRKHTAMWLFPQEKATFDRADKGTSIGEPL